MKVKLNEKIRGIDGKPLKKEDKEDLTLHDLCIEACLVPVKGEEDTPEEKVKNYLLFKRIADKKEVELKAEEIAFLKQRIGKLRPTLVVGQAWEILEGKKMK